MKEIQEDMIDLLELAAEDMINIKEGEKSTINNLTITKNKDGKFKLHFTDFILNENDTIIFLSNYIRNFQGLYS